MTHWRAVTLAVLVVLAGCSGALGDSDADGANTVNPALAGTPTETPSPTPSPVPTPTATPTLNESLPPSLSTDSVDALFLADAHRRGLVGASRTVVQTISIRAANGTTLGRSVARLKVDGRVGGGRIFIDQRVSGRNPSAVGLGDENVTYWGNDTVTVARREAEDGTVSYSFDRSKLPPAARSDTTGQGSVVFAFAVGNVTSVERVGTDPARFRVHAGAEQSPVYEARNVSLVAVVTESGVVRSFRLSYVRERGGEQRRIVREFRVIDVGETSVDPPDWFETARNETVSGS